jgi:hypothetical protein
MQALTRAFTPHGNYGGAGGSSQQADAAAAAAREQAQLQAQQAEDERQRRGGQRGVRSLLSGAGFLGFPAGRDTLGG